MCIRDRYIPGKKNIAADILSRINIEKQTFEGEKEKIAKIYNIIRNRSDIENIIKDIRLHQQTDTKLINIRTKLDKRDDRVSQFYCLHDRILFVKPKLSQGNWKIVIPRTMEKELVLDYHIRYGHMGALKVIKALENRFI